MSVWTQVFLNRLVWENGDTLVVNSSTRRDVYLEVYLVWHGNTFTYCSNVQGICDHSRALLEVEWEGNRLEHQVVSLVTVYHGTNVTDLQCFLGGVNLFYGEVMVVVLRKFGNVLRKQSSRISIFLSHIIF
jgi:hypothetical protein